MSEGTDTSTQDGTDTSGTTSAAGDEFNPITSQEDLNKVISERLARERAKYADYKDLKAKAEKLTELEKSQMTEAEKVAERIASAEAEVAAIPAKVSEALRAHLVTLHEINDEDAELFLNAQDPDTLLKQVTRLLGRAKEARKGGNNVPREGANTTPSPDGSDAQFAKSLLSGS